MSVVLCLQLSVLFTSTHSCRSTAALLAIFAVAQSYGSFLDCPEVYSQLEQALVNGSTNSTKSTSNLKILEDAFFPMQKPEPVCVPVEYTVTCDGDTMLDEMFNHKYTYLWTEYYMSHTTGALLYSFARSGLSLRGFEWEKSCHFDNASQIDLRLDSEDIDCSSKCIQESLSDITSQVERITVV